MTPAASGAAAPAIRIAICGHSHHRVTQSNAFLRQLLQGIGALTEYWDESWLTGVPFDERPVVEGGFDAVVVWQMELLAQRLARHGLPNLTFFPMYDGCHTLPDSYWQGLGDIKSVCFSSTLHEKLQRLGVRSRFVRYWPDPRDVPVVAPSEQAAGYFWQRQQDVTWATIRPLLGTQSFGAFTLHKALDPSFGDFVTPSDEDVERYRIRTTSWFASREEAAADLRRHNVYFAPRLREGIGMSFLEAMAMGFLVVAPDAPTMNEYIVSGCNGLLYDPAHPAPLDLAARARLGAAARRSVEQGWRKWSRSVPALLRFVLAPSAQQPIHAPFDVFDPLAVENLAPARFIATTAPSATTATGATTAPRATTTPGAASAPTAPAAPAAASEGGRRLRAAPPGPAPRVTVATVTRNAQDTLRKTLDSILCQDGVDLEIIVLDGASTDGTLAILREYDSRLDLWRSAADGGPFDAMNAAARAARGHFILFMNAGDWFQSTDALALALDGAPDDADLIYGHHVYRNVSGHDELHLAADFARTWERLQRGEVDWRWLSGVPGHQATLTRVALLREQPYRGDLRIAADHEFLYRLARQGGRFHACGTVVSTYVGGGLSWRNLERCFEEWRLIAAQYTAEPERTRAAFARMQSELQAGQLRRRRWPGLLPVLLGGRHALVVLAWRARERLARMRRERLRRRKILRVDFGTDASDGALQRLAGLSAVEGPGRWSDGERVVLEFKDTVRNPRRLSIHIRHVFGPNVGKDLVVRIGGQAYHHRLERGEQRFSAVLEGEPACVPPIELLIPAPASPASLGVSADARRLGVLFRAIELQLS